MGITGWLRLVEHRLALAWRALFPGRIRHYGDGGTIQRTGEVNVEVDPEGKVVSVWFRCALLPFTENVVGVDRAKEMRSAYKHEVHRKITAIDFLEPR